MKCSCCETQKLDFAEDRQFVVLEIEDYKRISALGIGRPMGLRWEIEGWKVGEVGRYRSAICADCASTIGAGLSKKRLVMTATGLGFLVLSGLSIWMTDSMPVVALVGGWFIFPILGLATLVMAHQLGKQAVGFDVHHRRAWDIGKDRKLFASYGVLPRERGVLTRFLLEDWEKVQASYLDERRRSGWSHFIITLRSSLAADEQPSIERTLEAFKAAHMGEVMDQHPHTKQ
jgi:hypothetical protein